VKVVIAAGVVAALISAASATAAFVVTSANIKNGTIQMADMSSKATRALKGNRGPRGFAGQDGFDGGPGPQGPQGPQGIQRLRLISTSITVLPGQTSPALPAMCAPGEVAISGGFIFAGIPIGSSPAGQSWLAKGFNDLSIPTDLYVYAYCSGGITTAVAGALPSDALQAAGATVSRER
jgi:hypothetical protein